ncbi:MAG: asparagine--tRNA ligase [Opitutae bacterium]|nr:asparagine--tRNA ligase [Opitutae bacterium]
MNRTTVKSALAATSPAEKIQVCGWVRTRRDAKTFSFIELNDGSCQKNLQIIVDENCHGSERVKEALTGTAIGVVGELVASQGKGQTWEVHATNFEIIGSAPDTFPLQKKGHSVEFLREIPHLRARTNRFGAMFRVRSRLAFAVHNFFQGRGFSYVHTPLITMSDCEGAGELFRVTTLPLDNPPRTPEGAIDYARDFFARQAFLTVSGQLEAETLACALGNVYTFGPTFRAENSHTSRHASEFWMIEPEMAFCDLSGDIDVAEAFVKHLIADVMQNCPDEIEFFDKFVSRGLRDRLRHVLEKPFVRISYTEAVAILKASGEKFEFPVEWGESLQSEHERFLTEKHFGSPVAVYDYPKVAKPFYMRQNDDGRTVAAADLLVPGIGEIIGGSQREERLECLLAAMHERGLSEKDYAWYVDLRRFGSVPHAGFGLGFERMLMFVTGEGNIRDVIPFPRTPA